MSRRSCFALEWRAMRASRWTWVAAALVFAACVLTASMTISYASQMHRGLVEVAQPNMGDEFPEWLANSADALEARADLQSVQASQGPTLFLAILGSLGPMLAAIWAAGIVGSEFAWRTVRIKTAHFGWGRTVGAKLCLLLVGCAAATVCVTLLGFVGGFGIWAAATRWLPLAALVPAKGYSSLIPLQVGVVFCGLSCYALLAALLSVACRSTAAALIAAVAVPYLEMLAGVWWLPQTAYARLLTSVISYPIGAMASAPGHPSAVHGPWLSFLVLLAWSALFGAGGWLLARRQQIA